MVVALGVVVAWQQPAQVTNASPSTPATLDLDNLAIKAAPGTVAAPAPVAAAPSPPPEVVAADKVIAPPPVKFEGASVRKVAPPKALSQPKPSGPVATNGTWAVMIGVNDYPGSNHDLRAAVPDANDVDAALGRLGVPAGNRLVVRDGQATASVIRSSAQWLVDRAGPGTVAVFFFAGHVRKLSSGTEAMVGSDGNTVSDAQLAGILRGLRSSRAWIGVAACYGGGFTEVLGPGRVLTAAAPADKLAYENSAFNRSYLVEYMVRRGMIEDQASDTVQTAFDFARAGIARDFPGREPVQFEHSGGPLDLRPPGAPRRSPQPSQSPPPQQQQQSPPPSTTTTTAPPQNNGCKTLTLGIVTCGATGVLG